MWIMAEGVAESPEAFTEFIAADWTSPAGAVEDEASAFAASWPVGVLAAVSCAESFMETSFMGAGTGTEAVEAGSSRTRDESCAASDAASPFSGLVPLAGRGAALDLSMVVPVL